MASKVFTLFTLFHHLTISPFFPPNISAFALALTLPQASPLGTDLASASFRLHSTSPNNPLYNALVLSNYHLTLGIYYAVLVTPNTTTNDNGAIGFLNGTARDFAQKKTT
ncbi:hypothetical protein MMC25_007585 [Agyrium rufum]|nr:hypothetical protein [Agyrium rufum]